MDVGYSFKKNNLGNRWIKKTKQLKTRFEQPSIKTGNKGVEDSTHQHL